MSCSRKFCGILSGLQENPPVHALNQTPASGTVKVLLKKNKMYLSGHFQDLSSPYIASHVHLGNPGINGSVVFTLTAKLAEDELSGKFDKCANKFVLTDEQKTALLNGQYYVNIHTVENPTGELRAQLLVTKKCNRRSCNCDCGCSHKKKCKQYVAVLSGDEEVPPVETEAVGKIIAILNCDTLTLNGSFTGLSSDYVASHIHEAPSGSNGPVVFNLTPVLNLPPLSGQYFTFSNKFVLTEEQKDTLKASGFYINIHTVDFPAGELRGQLVSL